MQGLLLVNLGTPDSPDVPAVRRYLREFLLDPRVIDVNPISRWLIVNLLILPFRPKKSSEAYKEIWTAEGSPLLIHAKNVADLVSKKLPNTVVEIAMRYQNPSIASALSKFREKNINEITLFPLFPQYSTAAWASAVAKVYQEATKHWDVPAIRVIEPYYNHPAYLKAFASVARPYLEKNKPEKTIFTFHGVPERQIYKSDNKRGHCQINNDCCATISERNSNCYRAQCFATAHALANELQIAKENYDITFQSRLGRDPWLTPFTDQHLEKLVEKGFKNVAIISPSFVADCLETIEEIGIRAQHDFQAAGGERLTLIPSLNSAPEWIDAIVEISRRKNEPGIESNKGIHPAQLQAL